MSEKLFTNKDIRQILGIPERRIINLTEKGVISPFIDSSGAGSRRKYTYVNVIEFAFVENLIELGLGIHLVKRILTDLRNSGGIHDWVEDWDTYWLKAAKEHIQWLKRQHKANKWFRTILLNDGTNKVIDAKDINPNSPQDLDIIQDRLKPPKPSGILAYSFKKDGSTEMRIIPWGEENTLATLFLHDYSYQGKGLLIVNLGSIKAEVDSKI